MQSKSDPSANPAPVSPKGTDAGPAATPLQTVAMVVSYDGRPFQGWQVQPHGATVQGRLEEALKVLTGRATKVYGSGRTDTGVHALNQVAHFQVPADRDLARLWRGLNALGAPAISVKGLAPVGNGFHARHSATGKTYRYQVFNRPYPPVFGRGRCWWVRGGLHVAAMREAARHLVGTHDFSAFRSSECAAKSPVRTVEALAIEEGDWPDATLRFEITATGFLQHMARIIAGTLVAVGRGRLAPGDIPAVLAAGERGGAGQTAPGRGLYLVKVRYDLAVFPELAPLLGGDPPPG